MSNVAFFFRFNDPVFRSNHLFMVQPAGQAQNSSNPQTGPPKAPNPGLFRFSKHWFGL